MAKLVLCGVLFATNVSWTASIVAPAGRLPAMSKANTARRTATSPNSFSASLTFPANMLGPSALLRSSKLTCPIGSYSVLSLIGSSSTVSAATGEAINTATMRLARKVLVCMAPPPLWPGIRRSPGPHGSSRPRGALRDKQPPRAGRGCGSFKTFWAEKAPCVVD
jgi:hypothetical protein